MLGLVLNIFKNIIRTAFAAAAILILRCYQLVLSPLFGPSCRYTPSCSQYAVEAISRYGFFKGSRLTVKRLLRCHPWHDGGFDPVP